LEITDNAPEKQQNIPEKISLPEKTDKKTSSPVNKKESTKTEIKKTETKTETPKSLRESTKGRLEKDDLALLRREVETPPQLASLSPVVYTGTTNPGLAQININLPESEEYLDDEKYFVDMVKEKTGIQNINLSKITQAGLNAMSNISKEKFRFNTDEQGKLTKINYDSGFLAFSIPTTKKESND
jgi:hypothetical protein